MFTAPAGRPWDVSTLRGRYWRARSCRCALLPGAPVAPRTARRPVGVTAVPLPGGLPVRPRLLDLRHTYVAYLIAARWELFAIQLRLSV